MKPLFPGKEKRTQLYFRDDGQFQFRKLEIEDTFLVEKKDGAILRGWKHFFSLQFPFAGKRGIAADMVTLGFSRDIVLDPFDIIPSDEKPEKHKKLNDNPWVSEVAESRVYKHQVAGQKMLLYDKITLGLGVLTGMVVIAIILCVVGGSI